MNSITKKYGKKTVLDNATFEFEPNNLYLIVGKNGAGKTTLFKAMYGLIREYEGCLEKHRCAMVPDVPAFYKNKTGSENLYCFLSKEELARAQAFIDFFSMRGYIDTKFKTYSQGMRKKLAIVLGMSLDSEIVLLDEPTNGLDQDSVEKLKKLLSEQKKDKIIVVSSHDNTFADQSFVDKVLALEDGKISENRVVIEDRYYLVETLNEVDRSVDGLVEVKDSCKYVFVTRRGAEQRLSEQLVKFGLIEFKSIDYITIINKNDD